MILTTAVFFIVAKISKLCLAGDTTKPFCIWHFSTENARDVLTGVYMLTNAYKRVWIVSNSVLSSKNYLSENKNVRWKKRRVLHRVRKMWIFFFYFLRKYYIMRRVPLYSFPFDRNSIGIRCDVYRNERTFKKNRIERSRRFNKWIVLRYNHDRKYHLVHSSSASRIM